MKTLTYIIGEPGVGKSTLMKALMELFKSESNVLKEPVKHTLFSNQIVLGSYDREFGGTDTLSYTCVEGVQKLLEETCIENIYAEGDRISNRPFFDWCKKSLNFQLLVLRGDETLVEQRREQRGSNQNETWLRGRKSKVENLSKFYCAYILDASKSPQELAQQIFSGEFLKNKRCQPEQESLFNNQ